jgi:hypothetical protein
MKAPLKGRVYLDEQSSEVEYIVFFLVPASIQQAANTKTLHENRTIAKRSFIIFRETVSKRKDDQTVKHSRSYFSLHINLLDICDEELYVQYSRVQRI